MMMPPDYAPGLPTPPGGGDPMMGGPAPPQDSISGSPLPSGGGIDGLMAALQGGGGGDAAAPGGLGSAPPDGGQDLDSVGHIQEAMKHLLMAMAKDQEDQHGLGITKGMGALQGILSGEQKKQSQLAQLSSPGG
jgi:hypothetical protein